MNMSSGHGGVSGRYEYLREVAFKYAFVLRILYMEGIMKKTVDKSNMD
jgi:oligopeptidase B